MGYPASVGVTWHIADRVAIRPEISLVQSSGCHHDRHDADLHHACRHSKPETTSSEVRTDSTTVGTGISALFYLWKREALSAFVTPRYALQPRHQYDSGKWWLGTRLEIRTGNRNHLVSGSFGAQYALGPEIQRLRGDRARLHTGQPGQRGADKRRCRLVTPQSSSETTIRGVSTRSGAGVVFYFR